MKNLWLYVLGEFAVGSIITWLIGSNTSWLWGLIPFVLTLSAVAFTTFAFVLGEPAREYGEDYAEDTMR
jgi:predicted RND superfamily exporter protein